MEQRLNPSYRRYDGPGIAGDAGLAEDIRLHPCGDEEYGGLLEAGVRGA
jgi:hypothetical protein